jgi:hypothetical protein
MLVQLEYWHLSDGVRDTCVFVVFSSSLIKFLSRESMINTSALARVKAQYKHLSCMQLGLTLLVAITAHERPITRTDSRSEISWLPTSTPTDR